MNHPGAVCGKTPVALFGTLSRHRGLLLSLAWREIVGRYKGSLFGLLWSFFNPLVMLAIYSFVFSQVFKVRWAADLPSGEWGFAMNLFAGLIVFNLFAESVSRAPSLILNHANYVTKLVFPLEILPIAHLLAALFHAVIGIIVLVAGMLAIQGSVPPTLLYVPLVLFQVTLFAMGISWILSAAGVYFRDLGQIVVPVVTGLLFLSPVFYPVAALPERWHPIAALNPLALPIEQVRLLSIAGDTPAIVHSLTYFGMALLVAWIGFAIFQHARSGFADVI